MRRIPIGDNHVLALMEGVFLDRRSRSLSRARRLFGSCASARTMRRGRNGRRLELGTIVDSSDRTCRLRHVTSGEVTHSRAATIRLRRAPATDAGVAAKLTTADARLFKRRWALVNAAERDELRRTSLDRRLQQLAALMASARAVGGTHARAADERAVRRRWAVLRRALGG